MASPAQPQSQRQRQRQRPSPSFPRQTSPSFDRELFRGRRILYIDDEPLVRNAVNRLLSHAGAHPLLAGTHEEAIALAASAPELSVAILDYHMPDGCVGRLIEQLRIVRPHLPMIGTSGAARHDDFKEHGVHHFVAKPWDLCDLIQVVGLACVPASRPARPGRAALPGDP